MVAAHACSVALSVLAEIGYAYIRTCRVLRGHLLLHALLLRDLAWRVGRCCYVVQLLLHVDLYQECWKSSKDQYDLICSRIDQQAAEQWFASDYASTFD